MACQILTRDDEVCIPSLSSILLPVLECNAMAKKHNSITTDYGCPIFSLKSRTFGLGQTNWANKFWGIWGIFGQTISTHFGAVSPLPMFSIIQPLFL